MLPSQITYIFVAYMFGCLTTLLFLGRMSNSFGFIRTLQIGLLFAIIGLSLSVFASNSYYLGLGRFIIGIASGLISTSAMLGLIYTIPDSHKQSAAQLSSIITVIGFGLHLYWWCNCSIFRSTTNHTLFTCHCRSATEFIQFISH